MFIPKEGLVGINQHKVEGHLVPREVCHDCLPRGIMHSKRGRPRLEEQERQARKELGIKLKCLRRSKRKTQIECAHAIGLTNAAAIANLESGAWFNKEVVDKMITYLKGEVC